MSNLDFWEWVDSEIERRGLNYYRMEMSSGGSNGVLSKPARNQSNPTFGACQVIAHGFDLSLERVLRKAGILDSLPPEVAEEGEAVRLFRQLSPPLRRVVIDCMHSMKNLQCLQLTPDMDETDDRQWIAAAGHLVDTMPLERLERFTADLIDHIEQEKEKRKRRGEPQTVKG